MECAVCNERFDSADHVPMVGKCGHSVCSQCAASSNSASCPLCRQSAAFSARKRNFQMIAMIEEFESAQKRQENQGSVHSSELSSLSFGKCASCSIVVEDKSLRVCLTCLSENTRKMLMLTNETDNIKMPMNSPCIARVNTGVLCGSCFLEGTHKGHDSQLWLPIKLCLDANHVFGDLETRKTIRRAVNEYSREMSWSLDRLDMALANSCSEAKKCDSMAEYKKFVGKCNKEIQELGEISCSLLSQMKEHLRKVDAVSQALRDLTLPKPNDELD